MVKILKMEISRFLLKKMVGLGKDDLKELVDDVKKLQRYHVIY